MLAVLAKPRVPITTSEELQGTWQVRSLQTGQYGAYTYPCFKCSISTGGKDNPTEEQISHNSVGHLYKLGKGHYLIIFAPSGPNGEMYEMKK